MPHYEIRTKTGEYVGSIVADYHNGIDGELNYGMVTFRNNSVATGFPWIAAMLHDVHIQPVAATYSVGQRVEFLDDDDHTKTLTGTITAVGPCAGVAAGWCDVKQDGLEGDEPGIHQTLIVRALGSEVC